MARTREFVTDDVIQKALSLFWDKGYNGVSTQTLIEEFGISKSSMYGAFGDKKSLFVEALNQYRNQVSKPLIELLDNCTEVKKTLRRILNTQIKQILEDKDYKGCFMVNTVIELVPHDVDIAKIVKKNRNEVETAFARAIKKAIKNGEISRNKNPESISRFLFSTMNGIYVDAKYFKDKKIFDDVVKTALSVLD